MRMRRLWLRLGDCLGGEGGGEDEASWEGSGILLG